MIRPSWTVDGGVLVLIAEDARTAESRFVAAVETEIVPRLQTVADQRLNPEPGPARLPFAFETERSRRWYFANKVEKGSKGGRYRRTGEIRQWKAFQRGGGGSYALTMENPSSAALWVYGPRQVRGHRGTWPNVERELEPVRPTTLTRMANLWFEVVGVTGRARRMRIA